MEPVFTLCGISTEVVVTRHFGDARENLLTRDLDGIDGIVVVGGDGTFTDIAQGLLKRTQKDSGLQLRNGTKESDNGRNFKRSDINEGSVSIPFAPQSQPFYNLSSTKFVSNPLPIGHIPGGSGNAFATAAAGVNDPTSSAILIALGKIMFTDVMGVACLQSSTVMVSVDHTRHDHEH